MGQEASAERWEHMWIRVAFTDPYEGQLDAWGADGWEAVGVGVSGPGSMLGFILFKRRVVVE